MSKIKHVDDSMNTSHLKMEFDAKKFEEHYENLRQKHLKKYLT